MSGEMRGIFFSHPLMKEENEEHRKEKDETKGTRKKGRGK